MVLVHGFEGLANAQHQLHEASLAEACVVHEVGVDHVLEVAAAVVGEEDVDGLGGGGVIADARDFGTRVVLYGVVDAVDDIWVRGEEGVCLDFLESLRDRFLAERTPDLFEGIERRV